jgi:hypothetical protein
MPDKNVHRWAIDAVEEGTARVEEDGARMITVPRYLLPAGAREGQIVRVIRSAETGKSSLALTVEIDEIATAEALAKSASTTQAAMAASRKRDPGGDVVL